MNSEEKKPLKDDRSGRPGNKIDSDNIRFTLWSKIGNNRSMVTNVLVSWSSGVSRGQKSLIEMCKGTRDGHLPLFGI